MKTALYVLLAAIGMTWYSGVTWYQISTASTAIGELLALPQAEIDKCLKAYDFMMSGTRFKDTDTATEHVRAYYRVANILLSIADIEKMYIPPQMDPKQGLYGNQLLWEAHIAETLNVGSNSTLMDIGCGRGRISHHMARLTGGKVWGFNIDASQIENAIEYAKETGMEDRLDFKVGDHHKPFPYADNTFDGTFSFEALWPFLKETELDHASREMFRVLKPGARYSCGEYLLTPHFKWDDKHHSDLHTLFLPTLAATQSNYPEHVIAALQRAGFKVILNMPSIAPAWPITDQKTDMFLFMRKIVLGLASVGLMPEWFVKIIDNMLKGGQAWAEAEKMKIADLNWRIIVEKPMPGKQQ